MSNPSQLLLLADHLKLSLLERQRAASLHIEPQPSDEEVQRSLTSLLNGIVAMEADPLSENREDAAQLRRQYNDLVSQFQMPSSTSHSISTLHTPNDPRLTTDFTTARNFKPTGASSLRRTANESPSTQPIKNVRFRDTSPASDAARAALLPYSDELDDEDARAPDHSSLDNQQIHAYHSRVLATQDAQLDALGASVGRQRELSIQIGSELDEQVSMLDDVDEHVDRNQSQLNRAQGRLGKVARKAKDNMQLTVIFILIIVLVLLIVILK